MIEILDPSINANLKKLQAKLSCEKTQPLTDQEMKLKEISEEEFDQLPDSEKILCKEIEYAHKFAYLFVNDKTKPILLCWRSDLTEPQILDDRDSPLLWFGVDEQLLAMNKLSGRVVITLTLASSLLELSTVKDTIILRTEFEIYSFSLNGLIQAVYSLPEISESMIASSNMLRVNLIDGQSLNLQI